MLKIDDTFLKTYDKTYKSEKKNQACDKWGKIVKEYQYIFIYHSKK